MSEEKDQNQSCQNNQDCCDNQEEFLDQAEQAQEFAEQVEQVEESLAQNERAEISLWKDQCKRISAEFENFKKRTERDQSRWADMAKEKIILDLLPFIDDFDRAMKQEGTDTTGIEMLYQSLIKLLEKNGVTMIKDNETFDPEFHEAVVQVESDVHESGQIVELFSQGFMMNGRVLRPAKVSVAQ